MLVELMVENYAVIERLRIRFHDGLNVLTGETGSGKSIVVDALGLLFGGRASADMLRSGSDRARLAGIFDTPAAAASMLEAAGIEPEDGELLIEREILANGKSRAFVASRPVTAALLRDLSRYLGDIHGQHDQQRLFSTDAQLEILDSFAAVQADKDKIAEVFRKWRSCARELEEIDRTEQEKLRLLDLWSFQRNEIESARLAAAEDEKLEAERRILQNVSKLMESSSAAYAALYDAPESAYAQLRVAVRRLEELCRIDSSLQDLLETLKPAEIAVSEASSTLRDYVDKLEADPDRLEDVENRLSTIDKLKRKYGASVEEILRFYEQVRGQMEAAETAADRRAAIEKQRAELAGAYENLAAGLTARRQAAARKLEKLVVAELAGLAMERTVFVVRFSKVEWTAGGSDAIVFLVSPNLGEEPKPLDKIASGGEVSRIALALKTCTYSGSGGADAPLMVFDEVDAGIGGSAGETVGRRLKQLAATNQVLCVTHLAQIAGFADYHFVVEKREVKGRTLAAVDEISGEARTREIGRMLSGQRLTPEALRHAEQLIRLGDGG
ncbi:MAG: DNA repair protein RecN [Bryobacteraceae bacterium]